MAGLRINSEIRRGRDYVRTAGDESFWIKSSLSSYNDNCVEVAGLNGNRIWVRDSKHPRGPVLNFTSAEWDAFIGGVYNGEFDRKPAFSPSPVAASGSGREHGWQ